MAEEPEIKKSKLDVQEVEGSSEDLDGYDEATQKALEEIDSCQNELDSLTEKASEEILKVEQKYNSLRKPFFSKRGASISKIPNFWLTAFVNHPQISAILEEEEEECLQFLDKVDVEEHDDIKSGYSIKFHFGENPFFKNDVLVKSFDLASQGDPTSSATKIEWAGGKNLVEQSKKRAKGKGALHQSFFSWFLDTTEPAADDIAEVIKDDMWPNPLQYYMGGGDEEENGFEGGDDSIVTIDEEDDEDDEDDDDELDEEDEGGEDDDEVEEEEEEDDDEES